MTPGPTKGKNGLYYYNYPGALGEQRMIQLAQQHKLWVAILVNETDRTPLSDGQPIPESEIFATRDRLKNAGLTVVATGWAEPSLDLHSQAAFIGHMAQGFDEYMLNIEAAWAYPQPGFSTSDQFAPLVRGALGQKPLSLCPDWGNQIHWKPWLDVGMFAIRVQCYLNEWPHKNPKDGLAKLSQAQHDLPNGVPASVSREAVYGKYGNNLQPLSTWTPQDDAANRPPRSVWAAEFCDEADVNWVAR